MDDFDDLRPRTSKAANPNGNREKRGAERPAADAATPDVYEAVQAARGAAASRVTGAPRRRRQPVKPKAKTSAAPDARARGNGGELDVPATVSALAIGAVIGFVLGFFSGKGNK